MSIQAVSYVLGEKNRVGPDFKGAELLVLIALANHTGTDDGECWPSVPTLARESRLTEKHVRECIRALIKAGEIERVIGAAPDTRIRADHRPNLYRLTGYLQARAGGNTTGTGTTGTGENDNGDNSGTREMGTKPSSQEDPSSSSDDDVFAGLIEEVAAGRGPAKGKEQGYIGRILRRNITRAESIQIMEMVHERAAAIRRDRKASRAAAANAAQERQRRAEERSRAEGARQLGLSGGSK